MTVQFGQYCQYINDEVFGICRQEAIPEMPKFDPNDPNRCANAVDLFP
jgi:hypothetical protein